MEKNNKPAEICITGLEGLELPIPFLGIDVLFATNLTPGNTVEQYEVQHWPAGDKTLQQIKKIAKNENAVREKLGQISGDFTFRRMTQEEAAKSCIVGGFDQVTLPSRRSID